MKRGISGMWARKREIVLLLQEGSSEDYAVKKTIVVWRPENYSKTDGIETRAGVWIRSIMKKRNSDATAALQQSETKRTRRASLTTGRRAPPWRVTGCRYRCC